MPTGTTVQRFLRSLINITINSLTNVQSGVSVTTNAPGNVGQRPFSNRAGFFKIAFVCATSLYVGGLIAHKGASYLEENEIFVPTDEDDDD